MLKKIKLGMMYSLWGYVFVESYKGLYHLIVAIKDRNQEPE